MRLLSWIFVLFFITSLFNVSSAQTLTEKLIAEDASKLVDEAKKSGDIVRGAILFHQGNINCAKCHRSASQTSPIGPDLSKIDPKLPNEHLVDSILQPSKEIKEGFETSVALLVDGRVIRGMVVEKDDQKIVFRDIVDVDKLISIPVEDIEDLQVGKESSMPADLANELKDRRQFLDLLRYVIDIKTRGPNANQDATNEFERRELTSDLSGIVAIQQHNCVACHSAEKTTFPVAAKQAPRLQWSAKWINPSYMQSFIANPHQTKPGTSMPAMLDSLDDEKRTFAAQAITQFLTNKMANEFAVQPIDPESVLRGNETFHSVGCVACHSPRDSGGVELGLANSKPLGDLSRKYNIDGLSQLLEDPLVVRPSGHMPNMVLTHREAIDIAHFLLQSQQNTEPNWEADRALAVQGEAFFTQLNCASCHTDVVEQNGKRPAAIALSKVDPSKGCLAENDSGNWPRFELDASTRKSIREALNRDNQGLDNEQKIDVSLATFNCLACHSRDHLGGVTVDRNPHFKTTNLNLGDQGRIPPTLTGVGAKLNPKWMRDVMVNQRAIRPYMKTRMPQFGEENISPLMDLFQATDTLPKTKFATFDSQEATRKTGLMLAGNKGLNCVACHTYKFKISDTMPAVDLTEMAERLKKDWFYQYMLHPQRFSPNTVMPSFWPDGQAIRKDLQGMPEDQIEALWQYLIDGRQANMPSGVVREPLEIVVTQEAQMLRRSYPGIGKRGIGVGYPGSVNLAFDAEQMRLGSIWKGKFADPGGVWTGQGSGNVRPMGRPIDFGKGPELDRQSSPWVVDDGRPPRHQFKGYQLDRERRPTFFYRMDSIAVEDYFHEVSIENPRSTHLNRQIELSSDQAEDDLRFRIAAGKEIKAEADGTFLIDQRLRIEIARGQLATIVDAGDQKQLTLPLKLEAKKVLTIELNYFWE